MAADVVALGRKMLVWIVALTGCIAVLADGVAASFSKQWAQAFSYLVAATLLASLAAQGEKVKRYIGE